jgi:hypothetical protein
MNGFRKRTSKEHQNIIKETFEKELHFNPSELKNKKRPSTKHQALRCQGSLEVRQHLDPQGPAGVS